MTTSPGYCLTHVVSAQDNKLASAAGVASAKPEKNEVLINPRYHFNRPLAVLRSELLDSQEKIDVLEGWAEDLREESQPISCTFGVDPMVNRRALKEIRSAEAARHETMPACLKRGVRNPESCSSISAAALRFGRWGADAFNPRMSSNRRHQLVGRSDSPSAVEHMIPDVRRLLSLPGLSHRRAMEKQRTPRCIRRAFRQERLGFR
jgi:hypothetical protein